MAVETIINYFHLDNPRVFYPGTAGYQRRKFDKKTTTINDVRGREDDFTLDKNGFVVLKGGWSEEDVEDTPEHIQNVVFPETIEKVKQAYVLLDTRERMKRAKADIFRLSGLVRRKYFHFLTWSAGIWPVQ
jgi:hypothetical protein